MLDLALVLIITAGLAALVIGCEPRSARPPKWHELLVSWVVIAALIIALSRRPTP